MDDRNINARVEIIQGDMLSLAVDAIVNAANEHLLHGGGTAGQIVRKGRHQIQEESSKCAPIKVGDAVITSAGELPARFVIHAVGPRIAFPTHRCAQIMKQAVHDFLKSPTSLEKIIICHYEDEKFRIFLDDLSSELILYNSRIRQHASMQKYRFSVGAGFSLRA